MKEEISVKAIRILRVERLLGPDCKIRPLSYSVNQPPRPERVEGS